MNVLFSPEVIFDESMNSYTILVKDLNVIGCGDSLENALDSLMDKIENLAFIFFDNTEFYLEDENYKNYYDYFLGISRCTKNEFREMLGLKN